MAGDWRRSRSCLQRGFAAPTARAAPVEVMEQLKETIQKAEEPWCWSLNDPQAGRTDFTHSRRLCTKHALDTSLITGKPRRYLEQVQVDSEAPNRSMREVHC